MCFSEGVVGTLSDRQEIELCKDKNIMPASKELKQVQNQFSKAVMSATKKYKGEGIGTWGKLLEDEFSKGYHPTPRAKAPLPKTTPKTPKKKSPTKKTTSKKRDLHTSSSKDVQIVEVPKPSPPSPNRIDTDLSSITFQDKYMILSDDEKDKLMSGDPVIEHYNTIRNDIIEFKGEEDKLKQIEGCVIADPELDWQLKNKLLVGLDFQKTQDPRPRNKTKDKKKQPQCLLLKKTTPSAKKKAPAKKSPTTINNKSPSKTEKISEAQSPKVSLTTTSDTFKNYQSRIIKAGGDPKQLTRLENLVGKDGGLSKQEKDRLLTGIRVHRGDKEIKV